MAVVGQGRRNLKTGWRGLQRIKTCNGLRILITLVCDNQSGDYVEPVGEDLGRRLCLTPYLISALSSCSQQGLTHWKSGHQSHGLGGIEGKRGEEVANVVVKVPSYSRC